METTKNYNRGKTFPKEKYPNYGWRNKKLPEEMIKKIRKSNIGRKGMIGKENPMYGKHHSQEVKERIGRLNKGNTSMEGKKLSEETKRKISETRKRLFKENKIKPSMLGRHHSTNSKIKIGVNHNYPYGVNHPLFGIGHKKEAKQKIKLVRAKQILPLKDTSIEVKLQNYLKQLGIEFYTHQYMKDIEHGYQCDILIPKQNRIEKPIIIEAFGDYWHKIPYGNEIDNIRCQELRQAGFKVLVFWENEIKVMELNDLKNNLKLMR